MSPSEDTYSDHVAGKFHSPWPIVCPLGHQQKCESLRTDFSDTTLSDSPLKKSPSKVVVVKKSKAGVPTSPSAGTSASANTIGSGKVVSIEDKSGKMGSPEIASLGKLIQDGLAKVSVDMGNLKTDI